MYLFSSRTRRTKFAKVSVVMRALPLTIGKKTLTLRSRNAVSNLLQILLDSNSLTLYKRLTLRKRSTERNMFHVKHLVTAMVANRKSPQKQQITFTLRGADVISFNRFKEAERLTKDAEVAQKLVRERLAQLEPKEQGVAA